MAKEKTLDGAAEQAAVSIKARVLTECVFGAANTVVTLSAEDAEAAKANGLVDTSAEAVAYAESLAPQ